MKLKTQIGSEIYVAVLFDYVPAQEETALDDARDEDLTINAVLVDDDAERDILETISDETIDNLARECIEHFNECCDQLINRY